MPQPTITEINEPEPKVFAKDLSGDRCAHNFKRTSPHEIKCTKCHMGLYDDPTCPAPIEDLNMYYSLPRVQKFNQWL
jgi:hypothetical protein